MPDEPDPCPLPSQPEMLSELHNLISHSSSELHYIQNRKGKLLYVSPSVFKLTGLTQAEYIERRVDILDRNSPRTTEVHERWKQVRMIDPAVHIAPYLIDLRLTDGSCRTHEIHERWHIGADDEPFLVGLAIDVTERAIVESKFERIQELTGVVNYIGDITPDSANTVYVGPSYERVHGIPRERIFEDSRAFLSNVHPDDIEELERTVESVFAGRGPDRWHLKYRVIHPDGSVHWLNNRGVIERGIDGAPRRWVGLVEDITEQVLLEQEHLEREQMMIRGQKLEAVGHLAAGVAHNFSNLLMALQGYIDLAKRTLEPNHPAIDALARIEETSDQARGITRSLLTFSRQQPEQHSPFNLSKSLENTIRLLRRTLPSRVRVQHQIEPDVFVLGDRSQLDQVILNIAINARDAMPDGGTLTIGLTQNEQHISLTLADTGEGMDEATREHVFEPFFTTKPADQGTGLGLSISHNIVREHGGTIELDSAPGKGTRIEITFQRLGTEQVQPTRDVPVSTTAGRAVLLQSPGIVRKVITKMLTELGYDVVFADSVGAAQDRVREQGVGVLLIDPDTGAAGTRETLQGVLDGANVPRVVLLTDEPKRWDGVKLGSRGVLLPKPFMQADLARALRAPSAPAN